MLKIEIICQKSKLTQFKFIKIHRLAHLLSRHDGILTFCSDNRRFMYQKFLSIRISNSDITHSTGSFVTIRNSIKIIGQTLQLEFLISEIQSLI